MRQGMTHGRGGARSVLPAVCFLVALLVPSLACAVTLPPNSVPASYTYPDGGVSSEPPVLPSGAGFAWEAYGQPEDAIESDGVTLKSGYGHIAGLDNDPHWVTVPGSPTFCLQVYGHFWAYGCAKPFGWADVNASKMFGQSWSVELPYVGYAPATATVDVFVAKVSAEECIGGFVPNSRYTIPVAFNGSDVIWKSWDGGTILRSCSGGDALDSSLPSHNGTSARLVYDGWDGWTLSYADSRSGNANTDSDYAVSSASKSLPGGETVVYARGLEPSLTVAGGALVHETFILTKWAGKGSRTAYWYRDYALDGGVPGSVLVLPLGNLRFATVDTSRGWTAVPGVDWNPNHDQWWGVGGADPGASLAAISSGGDFGSASYEGTAAEAFMKLETHEAVASGMPTTPPVYDPGSGVDLPNSSDFLTGYPGVSKLLDSTVGKLRDAIANMVASMMSLFLWPLQILKDGG